MNGHLILRRNLGQLLLLSAALLVSLICLTGWVYPLDELAGTSFLGDHNYDYAGYAVARVGDINGDGYADFLIGAYGNDDAANLAGKTYLFLGHEGADWGTGRSLDESADASFVGDNVSDWSGKRLSGIGDVNGDGYNDFLIGAPGVDAGATLTDSGKVYLILGRAATDWGQNFDLANADASFIGEEAGDKAGIVSAAGDVNGDGYSDFLISSEEHITRTGKTYLLLGKAEADWGQDFTLAGADASFVGTQNYAHFGCSTSRVGDVNGDGYDDFLIGAYGISQAFLILGRAGADWGQDFDVSNADASFLGENSADLAGYAVSLAGDMNGDGYDDFAIGAYANDDGGNQAGKTYLIFGRPQADWGSNYLLANADASFVGQGEGDQSGMRLHSAMDMNLDGYDDLLIGAPYADASQTVTDTGSVYLVLGKPSGWARNTPLASADNSSAIWAFPGEDTGDYAGGAVAGVADVNGDHFPDVLVGAYRRAENGDQSGKVYLLFGSGLGLKKRASAAVAEPGRAMSYFISYRNANPWEVNGVKIVDRIPAGMTYQGCAGGLSCGRQGNLVTWQLGTLAAEVTGTVRLNVQVRADVATGTVVTNTAWITAPSRVNPVFSDVAITVRPTGALLYLPIILSDYREPVELSYDDGGAESSQSWETGKGYAVRFTPPEGATRLLSAHYYLTNPAAIEVHVWDAGHSDVISPFTATPTSDGWFDVDLSSLDVTLSGDFYVGFLHTIGYQPDIGVDTTASDGRSYEVDGGYWEAKSSDYMIRAVVQ